MSRDRSRSRDRAQPTENGLSTTASTGFMAMPPPASFRGGEWEEAVLEEWRRRHVLSYTPKDSGPVSHQFRFPLIQSSVFQEEILAVVNSVLDGQFTMSTHVKEFEIEFARKVGVEHAIMCNSGSSANLLAFACATNPARKNRWRPGDEILIPAVCWSTSLWPILQFGLKPCFVDVEPETLNIDVDDLERKINSHTKGILMVHVLGNSCDMERLQNIVTKHKLILIEDTCESLGSTHKGKMLGTIGSFGSYSFYFSHHITTGEGGMVVCHNQEDADLLKCLRAHGWSREMSNKQQLERQNPDVDKRFLFVNMGYNLRPLEISGALGLCQLRRLNDMNATRNRNRARLIAAIESDSRYDGQLQFTVPGKGVQPCWFGFCALLNRMYRHQHKDYLQHLSDNGIENRPIISGNFARQPGVKMLFADDDLNPEDYPGSENIGNLGFFIGVHAYELSEEQINFLVNAFLSFNFRKQRVILVTGGTGVVGQALKAFSADPKVFPNPEADRFIFLGSADGDLCDLAETKRIFNKHKPTHVIHLAVKLAGSHEMKTQPFSVLSSNLLMNENVLRCCAGHKVEKVVACGSVFAYPEEVKLPITEDQLHAGALHPGYESYGFAKRQLETLCRTYRAETGANYVSIIPSNIYGPMKKLRESGPMVDAMMAKCLRAKRSGEPVKCFGTGAANRQLLYAGDLAKVLVWALNEYNGADPVNVAGPEVTVKEVAETIASLLDVKDSLEWDTTKPDGPLYRTMSDAKLKKLMPTLELTPLRNGLRDVLSNLSPWDRLSAPIEK
eukprot:gnl/MRDRNA2_/MRDRNA2_142298_c0_seq1.p1 gnl/MRDRNA2_/MRDRNA2_142298_c0~~gnl/MRDRNA2_/MRDRNA2_142298_c0_seq1.p1  ORF type:complete len:787 (-),score=131.86 gnl/MRDRNA2_/MRDRNA2_142298_c0_seq1:50-2410(-)